MMVKIFFQELGEYDKATFVCLRHSDCQDKTPEDLPEDKREVWEKLKQELASLKEGVLFFMRVRATCKLSLQVR